MAPRGVCRVYGRVSTEECLRKSVCRAKPGTLPEGVEATEPQPYACAPYLNRAPLQAKGCMPVRFLRCHFLVSTRHSSFLFVSRHWHRLTTFTPSRDLTTFFAFSLAQQKFNVQQQAPSLVLSNRDVSRMGAVEGSPHKPTASWGGVSMKHVSLISVSAISSKPSRYGLMILPSSSFKTPLLFWCVARTPLTTRTMDSYPTLDDIC